MKRLKSLLRNNLKRPLGSQNPCKVSGYGKRETKYFAIKEEAMSYITDLNEVATSLRTEGTLMIRSQYNSVFDELVRLTLFKVTFKEVVDYYLGYNQASDAKKGNYIPNFSPTIHHLFSAMTYENRNVGGKLVAFLESAGGEVWEVMLAEIEIRYLKMTHAGRLEGGRSKKNKNSSVSLKLSI